MKDFEVSAEPVQDWLSKTEKMVQAAIACMICQPRDENSRSCRWPSPSVWPAFQIRGIPEHPGVRRCCLEIRCTLSWVQSSAFLWGVICPVLEPSIVCSLEIITPLGHVYYSQGLFTSGSWGQKLCLPCALPQPLNSDLLVLFSLSLRK